MKNYTVVMADTVNELETKVNQMISNGWTVQGSLAVASSRFRGVRGDNLFSYSKDSETQYNTLLQPMIKKGNNKHKEPS